MGFKRPDVALGFKGLPYGRIVISQSNAGSPLTDQISPFSSGRKPTQKVISFLWFFIPDKVNPFFFRIGINKESDIVFVVPAHTFLVAYSVLS